MWLHSLPDPNVIYHRVNADARPVLNVVADIHKSYILLSL